MKISNTGYVTIQKQSLLGMASTIGVANGKKRILPNGEVEAEFVCIRKKDNCETIWANRKEIIETNDIITT